MEQDERIPEQEQATPQGDEERASEPPPDTPPEGGEGESGSSQDPAEGPGPYGNPEVDEEALRKKQEESDSVAGN